MENYKEDKTLKFEYRGCPVCDTVEYIKRYELGDRRIVECKKCSHEFVSPAPLHIDRRCVQSLPGYKDIATSIDSSYLRKVIEKHANKRGRFLDLGAGHGRISKELVKIGVPEENITLMDMDEEGLKDARMALPRAGYSIGDAERYLPFQNYFDCVLMVEFLEHMVCPRIGLDRAMSSLKPGGILIARNIPNNQSYEAFIAEEDWFLRKYEQHFHFFNQNTFSQMAARIDGAEIIDWSCFLHDKFDFDFYGIERIAKHLGLAERYKASPAACLDGIIGRIRTKDHSKYIHAKMVEEKREKINSQKSLEDFFNRIHLVPELSPDFSAVIKKQGGNHND